MSMEHKAFVFAFREFNDELRPILESALSSSNVEDLVSFIDKNRLVLVDPYEGKSLPEMWQDLVETPDAHQCGDIALTKYYDPREDIGLGYDWEELHELFLGQEGATPVLGLPCGTEGAWFDPGKMGSYFQSEVLVIANVDRVLAIQDHEAAVGPLLELLCEARNAGKGLYVTF